MAITSIPCASHKGFKFFVHIDGELTINSAEQDLIPIRKLLGKNGGVIIDGSEVTTCDGAGFQLLCSFFAELDRQKRLVVIEQFSPILDALSISLGIDLLKRYPKDLLLSEGSHESA